VTRRPGQTEYGTGPAALGSRARTAQAGCARRVIVVFPAQLGPSSPKTSPHVEADPVDRDEIPVLLAKFPDPDDGGIHRTTSAASRGDDPGKGRGLNIAHEAVDRHAAGPNAEREALRFVRADGSTHSLSYAAEVETARLRQDLELDSLDFLRLIETIAQATGVDTPERDYGQVATVQGLVDYVAAHG